MRHDLQLAGLLRWRILRLDLSFLGKFYKCSSVKTFSVEQSYCTRFTVNSRTNYVHNFIYVYCCQLVLPILDIMHWRAAFMSFTGGTGGRRFINTIGRTTMTRKVNVPMYQVFRVQC
jgi:hypothetical protein